MASKSKTIKFFEEKLERSKDPRALYERLDNALKKKIKQTKTLLERNKMKLRKEKSKGKAENLLMSEEYEEEIEFAQDKLKRYKMELDALSEAAEDY